MPRPRDTVWKNFLREEEKTVTGNKRITATCVHCKRKLIYRNPTQLLQHLACRATVGAAPLCVLASTKNEELLKLKKACAERLDEEGRELQIKRKREDMRVSLTANSHGSGTSRIELKDGNIKEMFSKAERIRAVELALCRWAVACNVPFEVFDHEEWPKAFQAIQRGPPTMQWSHLLQDAKEDKTKKRNRK